MSEGSLRQQALFFKGGSKHLGATWVALVGGEHNWTLKCVDAKKIIM